MPRVEVGRQLGGVPTPAFDMQKAEKKEPKRVIDISG